MRSAVRICPAAPKTQIPVRVSAFLHLPGFDAGCSAGGRQQRRRIKGRSPSLIAPSPRRGFESKNITGKALKSADFGAFCFYVLDNRTASLNGQFRCREAVCFTARKRIILIGENDINQIISAHRIYLLLFLFSKWCVALPAPGFSRHPLSLCLAISVPFQYLFEPLLALLNCLYNIIYCAIYQFAEYTNIAQYI